MTLTTGLSALLSLVFAASFACAIGCVLLAGVHAAVRARHQSTGRRELRRALSGDWWPEFERQFRAYASTPRHRAR